MRITRTFVDDEELMETIRQALIASDDSSFVDELKMNGQITIDGSFHVSTFLVKFKELLDPS